MSQKIALLLTGTSHTQTNFVETTVTCIKNVLPLLWNVKVHGGPIILTLNLLPSSSSTMT